MTATDFEELLAQVQACTLCAEHLPLGPRPVVRMERSARLIIIGQAPGTKVHASGVPFDDPSGDRLRDWLGVDRDTFYDASRIAIMPMGFCYPGTYERGGDLPPRPECAPTWHESLLNHLPNLRLTLLVGAYAQIRYLGNRAEKTLTGTVARWREFLPDQLPTPHPSWRTRHWAKKNPWFAAELLPELKNRVADLM